ncbi:Calcipressin, partial [Trichodelitschia bisporula]
SRRSSGSSSPLTLDMSNLPQLITPAPPSNTLLITNLDNIAIFDTLTLESIREAIGQHATIVSWAPLKSFRRIIAVFANTEHATAARQKLDGEYILGSRARVYFGTHTEIRMPDEQHLKLPKADKLFFISPPPSPPHGWELRNEEPPNKAVHADDLAEALAKLRELNRPNGPEEDVLRSAHLRNRSRSSTLVYHPDDHGDDPDLPMISVEDTTDESEESPVSAEPRTLITHTTRPPVELM